MEDSDPGLDEHIEALRSYLANAGPGSDAAAEITVELAESLYERYEQRLLADDRADAAVDLDEILNRLTIALANSRPDSELRAELMWKVGLVHYERWADGAGPDPDDLDRAIDLLLAAATPEQGIPELACLVEALADRVELRNAMADLDLLVVWCQRLLASCDPLDAGNNYWRLLLGLALMERADANQETNADDLDAAIACLEAALTAAAPGDPDRASLLTNVAHACWRRLDGDASWYGLVDKMTEYAEQAWALSSPDDPDRVLLGLYTALGTHERLIRPDAPFEVEAVNRAIDILTDIEPLMADEPSLRLMATVALAHFLVARGQMNAAVADLEAARPLLQRAIVEIDTDDPSWSEVTQTLAAALSIVAHLGMDIEVLDQAISVTAAATRWPHRDPARAALARGALGELLVQRAGFMGSPDDLDAGIAHLLTSHEMAPPGHAYRLATGANLAGALLTRFMERGQAEDVDAARYYLDMASSLTGPARDDLNSLTADAEMVIATNLGGLAVADGLLGDSQAFDRAVDRFRDAISHLTPGHPHAARLRSDLGLALSLRAASAGRRPGDAAEATRELSTSITAMTGTHTMRPLVMLRAGGALVAAAAATGDQRVLRQSIDHLNASLHQLDPRFGGRFRFFAMLGAAGLALHRCSGNVQDLDDAIEWLGRASRALDDRPYHPQYANCLIQLAQGYRTRGDARAAHDTGLTALRGRARELLLQSGTARSIGFARRAATEATEIAAWCFEDGRLADAVEALELGRGLILHASTCVTGFADLLVAAGQEDLAREWRETATASPDTPWDADISQAAFAPGLLPEADLEVPDDLRARALAAVAGTADELVLLAPPSTVDLAAAVASTGADALVYLLGRADGVPGRAIIVTAAGMNKAAGPAEIPLPWLSRDADEVLDEYVAALTASGQDRDDAHPGRWEHALDAVCEWAWHAVMQPVLGATRAWELGRPPRVVLVTSGIMSMVPWHAARYRPDEKSPYHYVLEDMVISYGASGRQLCDVAGRSPLPLAANPVIVGDPAFELPGARLEALAILRCHYPTARYLGTGAYGRDRPADGPGTPTEVLGELPGADGTGASVLHLGCHGVVTDSMPGRSYLQLAAGQQLAVDKILRQASGRPPNAPGGLVSLAACSSDLAVADYDEALTPATAFLAAGAVTAVGARWPVQDDATTLLMFMFHYLMSHRACSPRDALRGAQQWMLDRARVAPPEMPPELAERVQRRSLARVTAWAGFVHQGR